MLFSLSTVWKSSPSCFEYSRRTHGMTINALARLSRIGEAVRHVGVTNYGLRAVVDAWTGRRPEIVSSGLLCSLLRIFQLQQKEPKMKRGWDTIRRPKPKPMWTLTDPLNGHLRPRLMVWGARVLAIIRALMTYEVSNGFYGSYEVSFGGLRVDIMRPPGSAFSCAWSISTLPTRSGNVSTCALPDHRKDPKSRSPNLGPYTTKGYWIWDPILLGGYFKGTPLGDLSFRSFRWSGLAWGSALWGSRSGAGLHILRETTGGEFRVYGASYKASITYIDLQKKAKM